VLAAARDVKLRIMKCLLEMPEELDGVLHDEVGTFIREGLKPRLQRLLEQATSAEPTNALVDPQESLQEIFDMLQVNRLGYVELFDQRPGATVGNMTIPRELWRNYFNESSVMSAVDVPTFTAYRIDRTIWPDKATDTTPGAYRFHKPEEALAIQVMMLGDSASLTLRAAASRKEDAKRSPAHAAWARDALSADAYDFDAQCQRAQELLDEYEEYLTAA
jgi:hypothetical protein